MTTRPTDDIIDLRAVAPDGDLACDFTIANDMARDGLREVLAKGMRRPVRELPDGVEVRFTADTWDAVERYVQLESKCCSFLNLRAERAGEDVILQVTGRPDAKELIQKIFE